jgi:hypothetical protein
MIATYGSLDAKLLRSKTGQIALDASLDTFSNPSLLYKENFQYILGYWAWMVCNLNF